MKVTNHYKEIKLMKKKKETIQNLSIVFVVTMISLFFLPAEITSGINIITVRGDIYIDGALAQEEGIEVILTFPDGVETDLTSPTGRYQFDWNADNNLHLYPLEGYFQIIYEGYTLTPINNYAREFFSNKNVYAGEEWNLFFNSIPNDPPVIPSTPSPSDGATDASVDVEVSWTGGDPNPDDIVTYDVYFGSDAAPPLAVTQQSDTSYNPGTLSYDTTYYWKIVAWDDHNAFTEGPVWMFTTEEDTNGNGGSNGGGSSGGGSNGGGGEIQNQPPVANASAGEPYTGFVGEPLTFDGTNSYDPDETGTIISWEWDFGDGITGTGEKTTHLYTKAGSYTVVLTVTDNDNATGTYETTAVIIQPNRAPLTPTLMGITYGTIDNAYTFSAVSTDADGDMIRYVFSWGDETDMTFTEHYENNSMVNVTHTWSTAGAYLVEVHAEDTNNATSGTAELFVLIDVDIEEIDDEVSGYLLDTDQDGVFDFFHNNATGDETSVKFQEDGTYLLDTDGDGVWDYIYDCETGDLENYSEQEETTETPDYTLVISVIIVVLILIILFVLLLKRSK
jgi:PKD repeat protein